MGLPVHSESGPIEVEASCRVGVSSFVSVGAPGQLELIVLSVIVFEEKDEG